MTNEAFMEQHGFRSQVHEHPDKDRGIAAPDSCARAARLLPPHQEHRASLGNDVGQGLATVAPAMPGQNVAISIRLS
jgi:hypothetical protein